MALTQEQLRRIDLAIAEKVMGLPNISWDHPIIQPCYSYHDQAFISIPHYSTDIAAAWEVVEKMIRDGYEISQAGYGMALKKWDFSFNDGGGEIDGPLCDTAPHAICLAALKTKGIDVSEWVSGRRSDGTI